MTDADVDGAHIRTLLLTFFYRQMLELIERGHVYIAQPPLYKVKKGKQERYLKDEAEREAYLLELALENSQLFAAEGQEPTENEALKDMVARYIKMNRAYNRLCKRYHPTIVNAIRYMPIIAESDCAEETVINDWFAELTNGLNNDDAHITKYSFEVFSSGDGVYGAKVSVSIHGLESSNVFAPEFFASEDYKKLSALEQLLDLEESAYIQRNDRKQVITSIKQAFDWLLKEAEQGLSIQRYKGLGEMNPDQLWETTMDSTTRSLLQVKIEDVIGADEVFTTLMGDQVEPRREFIERNALVVENLDT